MTASHPRIKRPDGVELVAASRLQPHPSNPRRGDIDRIRESIATNGWHGVIVAQVSTGYILAGNHRFLAGGSLSEWRPDETPDGWTPPADMDRFPVQWVDVDEQTALRILLADNRTSDVATYDDPMLLQLFAQIGDPEAAGKILADPKATDAERAEALRYLAQTAPSRQFAGTGYDKDDVEQIALGLEGGGAVDNGARGNKDLDRERWATIDVRQIGLVMNETEFGRAVRILLFIRESEGLETNTDAVLWLLDRFDRELDGRPSAAEAKGATDDAQTDDQPTA